MHSCDLVQLDSATAWNRQAAENSSDPQRARTPPSYAQSGNTAVTRLHPAPFAAQLFRHLFNLQDLKVSEPLDRSQPGQGFESQGRLCRGAYSKTLAGRHSYISEVLLQDSTLGLQSSFVPCRPVVSRRRFTSFASGLNVSKLLQSKGFTAEQAHQLRWR